MQDVIGWDWLDVFFDLPDAEFSSDQLANLAGASACARVVDSGAFLAYASDRRIFRHLCDRFVGTVLEWVPRESLVWYR